MVYPTSLPLMRTPRLPVVYWTDAPAYLNGLVSSSERRNLASARVPSHFKHSLPAKCCTLTKLTVSFSTDFLCGYVHEQQSFTSWPGNSFLCTTRKSLTAFTTARHRSLLLPSESSPLPALYPIYLRSTWIKYSLLSKRCLFLSGSKTNTVYTLYSQHISHKWHMIRPPHRPSSHHPNNLTNQNQTNIRTTATFNSAQKFQWR
jgi:hypothetical protein